MCHSDTRIGGNPFSFQYVSMASELLYPIGKEEG
jgi:hypothetical protein